MKIAFNPSTVAALTSPPNNKDITFDLKGRNIFARGVKFYGTDTNTWRPVVDNLTSNSTTSSLSANQGRVLKALIDGKSDSGHNHDGRYVRYYAVTTLDCNNLAVGLTAARVSATNAAHTNNSVYLYISDIGTPFQIQIPDSNVPYIYKRYYSSGKWSGWFKLNAGYADSAGSVAWANITGKPSSYTPSAHTHAWNSLTHSSTTENQAILTNGKANGWKLYTLNISGWNNAANNAHSHSNKSVLDGITSGLVSNWNTAYTFVHTITGTDTDKVINKWDEIVNFLAGITEDNKLNTLLNNKLSVYKLADETNVGIIKNNGIYYSTTDASSGTLTNSPFNNGFALINMTSYDRGDDLRRSRLAFNAYGEIKVSDDRGQSNTAETWYNVLTSKNSGISGSTIKLNGTSITVYSSGTADGRYVKKSGDTMTGVLTIDTTNFGTLTIKRNDDTNGASIQFRGKSSAYGYIGLNNSTKDKQFLRWNSDISKVYTILDTSSTYTSSGKGVINGTTITQVDNADKLDGYHANTSQSPFGRVPTIGGDGVMEIGKYIDFHYDNEGKYDYSTRLQATGNHQNTLLLPSGTGTLALTSQIPNKNSWNYDDRYLKLTGGTMVGTINRRSGGSTISGRDHAIIRQTQAPGGSSWNPIACVDTETGTWTLGHLSSGSSNTDFSFCFSTNADYNAGNNNGNYVTLRNRVGTIALTSEIPSKGSWNYDDRYYTKAESNAKYITDITTSVNKLTFTKNGSSIARTITVNNVQSLGRRSPLTERNAISGIYTYGTYSATDNLAPTNYFETLGFGEGAAGTIEIGGSWISGGKLYWRALRGCCEDWFSWKTILDSSNYSGILDSRYYTESEVNNLLSKKLDRVNLSVGTWNPRGYHLAADYYYNGGDLSISENGGKMYVSIDGQFYQNEGQYRVLDTSDIGSIRGALTLYQYLSSTDTSWYPLVWGGSDHKNTNNSTGSLYKSYDKLSWQTSSQTLYATNIQTENIKHLSIGGGIYWNPCVESATNGSDAASITLVKSGVAGGTTLVLSQMNDANDTIQFKTSTAAKLYHNSYPILTTQNTYVNNRKGYIYGTEITQVNNSDTVDGYHAASSNKPWGTIPVITTGGWMDIGKHLEFHFDNTTGSDYSTILRCTGNYSNIVNLPSVAGTLALISDIPSSVKNPNAIKFKDINGNVVTYDGSAAKDLTSGTYIAKLPYGFASFASGVSWGNTTGTSFASWNDSTGGSIDFRRDNPSSGKMSIKVDGRVYVNEGHNPVLSAESNSGFWGMRTPDGGNDWIRTPNSGLIPYVPGGAGGGHSSLGTSSWYFSTAYIDKVYGSLKGNADTASSANKLTTARNIALGTDLRGSANFDGSGNITINANINACSVSIGSTNGLPFKRIAHFETGSSWNDNALLLYISQGYINGSNGICRVEFRTSNISTSNSNPSASALVRWLVRNGYGLDSLYAGYYVTAGKAYIDIYLKTTGGYQGTVIRVLQDSRGGINSNVQLINSYYHSDTNHKEAYSSIEAASTALYNRAYTKIVSGSDVGIVSYSNSTGSVHWNNVTNKPSSFTPSSHTHTWASITDKLVAGNEFNIVNAGFNEGVWFNYLPINDRNKTATVQGYHFGNGAKGYTNIKAAGFIKNGSNSSYVLLGDGGHKTISSLSVNYANSAGSATSATKVIVNQHTGNDINYPLVWSNQANTSNVTENQLYKSWADLYYNPKNKRLTVGGSVVSSSFVKSGGTSQQLLRADGGIASFNWSGQSGQPTWLWGGNSQHSYYVYNPSNFRVAYAASAGNADTLDGEHASNFVRAGAIEAGDGDLNALDTYSFIKSVNSKVASHSPKSATGWYNIIQAVHRNGYADGASYIGQIALGMTTNTDDMFFRGKRTDSWKTVIHSGNIGSQTVASASKLVTARKIWGQSFNGTADVNGTIYINNGDSENGAIILNNNVNTHARISAIKDNVVFNTGGAIRFGDLDWDYSKWAGLKYNYLTKTIYLGIADGSIFTTYGNVQNEGTLNLRANISHIDLNSGTSIRGLGTDGSPYYSSITLKNTSMSLSAYGDMTMSTGPGTMQLSAGNAFRVTANDIRLTCGEGSMTCSQTRSNRYTWMFNKALNVGGTLSINGSVIDCSASNISIKSKESGSLMIGTQEIVKYDSHAITFREKTRFLDVLCLSTIPFGSSSPNVVTTISTAVCIDVMNYDSQFIFKPATDGQLLFLKVVKRYSNNHIKCTAEDCEVVGAAGFDIYLNRGDTKDIFADGKSRIFIYVSRDKRWYEFYCG